MVGQSICRLINRNAAEHEYRCTAPATGGSVANLNSIANGDIDFGTVQSDWQYHALNGTSLFADSGPNEKLRSVLSAHADVVTIVARADSGIETLADLKGKKVNIGNPGSGSWATAEVLLETIGIDVEDLALAAELKSAEQSQALCDNKIAAMMFSAGHPVGNIKEATVSCDTVFLQVAGDAVDALVAKTPHYSKTTIPAGMYLGQPETIQTSGPLATIVTSTDADEAFLTGTFGAQTPVVEIDGKPIGDGDRPVPLAFRPSTRPWSKGTPARPDERDRPDVHPQPFGRYDSDQPREQDRARLVWIPSGGAIS